VFVSSETKTEDDDDDVINSDVKKRVPLSLEELLAKKKAEEEAQSKVREISLCLGHRCWNGAEDVVFLCWQCVRPAGV